MKLTVSIFMAIFGLNAFTASSSGLLLSAFCQNTGNLTSQALIQSQALGNIIETLEKDPECSGLAAGTTNLLNSIYSLNNIRNSADETTRIREKLELYEENAAIERANLLSDFESQYRAQYVVDNPQASDEEIDQQASLAVATHSPNSDYLTSLDLIVNDLKIEQFSNRLQVGFDTDDRVQERNQIAIVQANMSSVLSTLSTSVSCTNINETVAPAVVSSVLSLASTVIPGIVGSVVSLGSSLVNGADQLIRGLKYSRLTRAVDRNNMKEALSCTFEGLTNTYCKAQDTLNLIKYNQEIEIDNCINNDCKLLKTGIELLTKKSNSLNAWINSIVSGATPSNADAVSTYQRAITLRATFNVVSQTLEGMLNGARNERSRPGAVVNRIERNLMERLATTVGERSFESNDRSFGSGGKTLPYSDFFQRDKECGAYAYFYSPTRGVRVLEGRGPNSNETCLEIANRLFPNNVEISELQERVRNLTDETSATVAFQIQLVSEENTSGILSGYESVDNIFRSSPKKFLSELRAYYSEFKIYLENTKIKKPLLVNYIDNGLRQAERAEEVINAQRCSDLEEENAPPENNEEDESPINDLIANIQECDIETRKLSLLREILTPSQQLLSVQNSLRGILREHVEIAKRNGDISNENLLLLLNTSTENSSDILARNNLNRNDISEDADMAKSISKGNIRNFWKTFARGIYSTLKELREDGDLKVLGRLCVRAALSPLSRKQYSKLNKYCQGTVYRSLNKNVPDIEFNDVINQKFKTKACTVYNFKRKQQFNNNN